MPGGSRSSARTRIRAPSRSCARPTRPRCGWRRGRRRCRTSIESPEPDPERGGSCRSSTSTSRRRRPRLGRPASRSRPRRARRRRKPATGSPKPSTRAASEAAAEALRAGLARRPRHRRARGARGRAGRLAGRSRPAAGPADRGAGALVPVARAQRPGSASRCRRPPPTWCSASAATRSWPGSARSTDPTTRFWRWSTKALRGSLKPESAALRLRHSGQSRVVLNEDPGDLCQRLPLRDRAGPGRVDRRPAAPDRPGRRAAPKS